MPSAFGLTKSVVHPMERFAAHLKEFDALKSSDFNLPEGKHGRELGGREVLSDAMAQMQRAYIFATETMLAVRGSTEATKVFNTLLKGQ